MEEILGTETYQAFITQFFFSLVGAAISLLLAGANRKVEKVTTPYKFSLLFLLKDNWKRITLNLLVIFVTIRFFKELTGFELSLFFCLAIGFSYDKLLQLLKKKTEILDVNRKIEDQTPTVNAAK